MNRSSDSAIACSGSRSIERSGDPTILPTVACLIIGAVIAAYAAAVSVPDSSALVTMIALP
jgi:hypothetical protein